MSSRSYLLGLRVHLVPILVWLGTAACLVAMFSHRSKRFQVLGIAQGHVQEIAATCTGRLRSVSVELFDAVKEHETLAVIDTVLDDANQPQLVQARLATLQAEIDKLKAELAATADSLSAEAASLERTQIDERRRFEVDVESARLAVLGLKTTIEADRMTLESLGLNSKIFVLQNRLDANDYGPYQLKQLKSEYGVILKRIENNENLLAQAQDNLKQAARRLDQFLQRQVQPPSPDKALDVIHGSITVQERLMAELLVQRTPVELKSPFDGVVSLIQRRPGETVLAGQPILTVAETRPREIIAYATERQAGNVKEFSKVELVKSTEPAQVATSQVVYLGPTVEQMPQRLWRNPNIPQWGRPILIKIPGDMQLVAGETVGVRGL